MVVEKKVLTKQFTDMVPDARPFYCNYISSEDLEALLGELKVAKVNGAEVERPPLKKGGSENTSGYRRRMADYIKARTGIELPVNINTSCQFYNCIADFLNI